MVNIDSIDAPEADYLYVGPSQLINSGNGLRTAIEIYKDEIIAIFKGENLTNAQAKIRAEKGRDQYFISMPDGKIMDSMNVKCFAKYANDASGSGTSTLKNNASIGLDDDENVCLIATRNIRSGEEIFCGYGKRYWKKHREKLGV